MIKNNNRNGKIEIDLTGPQGNAFALLGLAQKFCKQLDREDDLKDIEARMMSGDYDNLIKVFDEEFGSFVTLYR